VLQPCYWPVAVGASLACGEKKSRDRDDAASVKSPLSASTMTGIWSGLEHEAFTSFLKSPCDQPVLQMMRKDTRFIIKLNVLE
jgi:hypothetical protein